MNEQHFQYTGHKEGSVQASRDTEKCNPFIYCQTCHQSQASHSNSALVPISTTVKVKNTFYMRLTDL